jgi:diadenosine tetraphosphate (Ap4A) HIT family hydrolase
VNVTIQAFGYPGSLIKEYEHWVALLRPEQITPGSLVLAAKSEATSLGSLTSEEWAEFSLVAKECEELLRATLGAEKFNYLALMMKDPNVHFHFVPRYSKPVRVGEWEIADPDWPSKTELNAIDLSAEELDEIKGKLSAGQK